MSDAWSTPPAVTPPKKRSGTIWAGVVMMLVGLVLGGVMTYFIVGPTLDILSSPTMAVPGTSTFTLTAGEQSVYERTNYSGPFPSSASTTISPTDITVTGPGGTKLPVTRPTTTESLSHEDGTYIAVGHFDATTSGSYVVDIDARTATRAMVGPSFEALGTKIAPYVLGAIVAGLLFVVGFIVWIVGLVRRPKRPAYPPPGGGYGPGPGWGPGPGPGGPGPRPGPGPGAYGPGPGYGPPPGAPGGPVGDRPPPGYGAPSGPIPGARPGPTWTPPPAPGPPKDPWSHDS